MIYQSAITCCAVLLTVASLQGLSCFTITDPVTSFLSSCSPVTWVVTPLTVTVSCSGWSAGSRKKGCELDAQMPCSATTLLNSATIPCLMSACSPVVWNKYTPTQTLAHVIFTCHKSYKPQKTLKNLIHLFSCLFGNGPIRPFQIHVNRSSWGTSLTYLTVAFGFFKLKSNECYCILQSLWWQIQTSEE